MDKITEEEKESMLKNAVSSYVHGVEHLILYKENTENIKFSVLHIFNAVELILKAYLGDINRALLAPKIDDLVNKEGEHNVKVDKTANTLNKIRKPGNKIKDIETAGIKTLMNRMVVFSEVRFNSQLEEEINKLRLARNDIEHKKFVLQDESDMMKTLIQVTYGLLSFCNENVTQGLNDSFREELKDSLDNVRSEFDPIFKEKIDKIRELKENDFTIAECPFCYSKSIAYKEAKCRVRCILCEGKVVIAQCSNCKGFSIEKESQRDPYYFIHYICGDCSLEQNTMTDQEQEEYYKESDAEQERCWRIFEREYGKEEL